MAKADKKKYFMAAAIDFGTTYCGYAFGLTTELTEESPKVYCPTWNAPGLLSSKTPTTILLNKNREFVAFGFEAEEQYAYLAEEDEHEDYYYFYRFKMKLSERIRTTRLTLKTTIPDIRGKELPAIEIFSHAIRCIKNHHLENMRNRGLDMSILDEILWILTIPAIWDNPGKQFMRKAGEKAEINGSKLAIALESEAALMWCTHLPLEKLHDFDEIISFLEEGRRYVVLDAGGETIDITGHEVMAGGKLKALERGSWGDCGGASVDKCFKKMLCDILGGERILEEYLLRNTADYIELFRDFELKKRTKILHKDREEKICLRVPVSFMETFPDIEFRTSQSVYKNDLQWKNYKLRISSILFDGFFKPTCKEIIEHVKEVLQSPKVRGTQFIVMVGGFSESPIAQDAMKIAFPNLKILIPKDPFLAVLKGAVLLHDKEIDTNESFVGIESKCIESDDTILLQIIPHARKSNQRDRKNAELSVSLFKAKNKNPTCLEDSDCNYMGNISVPVHDSTRVNNAEFKVTIVHGGKGENVTVEVSTASGFKTDLKFNCE